mgnify:FL=1|jgi:rhamnulokinase
MGTNYYLAVDIGASSGRHMLSHMENGKMILEEIYRFPNGMVEKNGHKVWDVDRLFQEILTGMKKCALAGKIPYSIGIDTWAVDFILLDEKDVRIGEAVAYRDKRTEGMDRKIYDIISEEALYQRTGIQKQIFNTIYQLMAVKEQRPWQLEQAKSMLMIPDYFHFLLTGKKVQEYTNATTTQLADPVAKDWDMELIEKIGYPKGIFQTIQKPGYEVGRLSGKIQKEVGFDCKVVLPPTHDTASAVAAVPTQEEHALYISSGTWSLMGTELREADCSKESMLHNMTNEGGYDYRFRYLKNIMGLWMIQSVKKESAPDLGFGEICALASKEAITSFVNVNDARFLAPENMTEEVKKACEESGQQVPQTIGELAAVIYHSLAECYAKTVEEIEALTGITYPKIQIVGGGANAQYLNELTAKYTGKNVCAGPTEATAVGNLAAQMIAAGELKDLKAARACIAESFEMNIFRSNQQ